MAYWMNSPSTSPIEPRVGAGDITGFDIDLAICDDFSRAPKCFDQLVTLASDTHTPLTVFPFNPRSVTDDMLDKLGDSLLGRLQERAAKRREAWWKELAQRIEAMRNR